MIFSFEQPRCRRIFFLCLLILLSLSACRDQSHFDTDQIIYLAKGDNGRYQLFAYDLSARNPEPKQLTTQDQDILEFDVSSRHHTAFTQTDEDNSLDIWLLWNSSEETVPLVECGPTAACKNPRWSPTQNVFAYELTPLRDGEIVRKESRLWWYDLESFQLIPMFEDENWLGQDVRFAADGRKLSYIVPAIDEIQVFDLKTGEIGAITSRANVAAVWGADSDLYFSALQVDHERSATHIFKTDASGTDVVNLTGIGMGVDDGGYVVAPDGVQLAFTRKPPRGGAGRQIWLMDVDGSNQRSLTDNLSIQHGALSWNSSGTQLLFQRFDLGQLNAEPEIWLVDIETGEMTFVVQGTRPQFAP